MFVFLLQVAAAAATVGSGPSLYTDATPPERYRHNADVRLEIRSQPQIETACQPLFGQPPKGMKTDACSVEGRVILPNPCDYPETERFARLLCHELAHVNGWGPDHAR